MMTKAQLLADLEGRDFVLSVGTPELQETKPEGTKLYLVPTLQNTGDAATYLNVLFFVQDEGGAGEAAFYKDIPPIQKARNTAFEAWMIAQIDAAPNSFKGVQVLWKSERWEMIIYSILTGTTPLTQKVYYIRKNQGAAVEISAFNLSLLASLLKV